MRTSHFHSILTCHRAGFFPGAIYLCSYWYMPKDLALRISYFYCASALSGAFSGLLAAAIAEMDGVGGYHGWRWIFIIEGLATVVIGVASFFSSSLTPRLCPRAGSRLRISGTWSFRFSSSREVLWLKDTSFKWRDLKMVLLNWRVYIQAYFLLCQSALSYGKPSIHSSPT